MEWPWGQNKCRTESDPAGIGEGDDGANEYPIVRFEVAQSTKCGLDKLMGLAASVLEVSRSDKALYRGYAP